MGQPPKSRPSHPRRAHVFKEPSIVPQPIQIVLCQAMALERMPAAWFDDMLWILAQESEGNIGIRNSKGSTARGLFQMMEASYHLLPRGAASFGNSLEECQGGVRYVQQRYHTAANAKAFWLRHLWY